MEFDLSPSDYYFYDGGERMAKEIAKYRELNEIGAVEANRRDVEKLRIDSAKLITILVEALDIVKGTPCPFGHEHLAEKTLTQTEAQRKALGL